MLFLLKLNHILTLIIDGMKTMTGAAARHFPNKITLEKPAYTNMNIVNILGLRVWIKDSCKKS